MKISENPEMKFTPLKHLKFRNLEGIFDQIQHSKGKFLAEIVSKTESLNLPEDLAKFLQERCQTYLQEKELEEFMSIPIPSNVKAATKLDPFKKALMEKKGLNKIICQYNEHQKVHERLFHAIYGNSCFRLDEATRSCS